MLSTHTSDFFLQSQNQTSQLTFLKNYRHPFFSQLFSKSLGTWISHQNPAWSSAYKMQCNMTDVHADNANEMWFCHEQWKPGHQLQCQNRCWCAVDNVNRKPSEMQQRRAVKLWFMYPKRDLIMNSGTLGLSGQDFFLWCLNI